MLGVRDFVGLAIGTLNGVDETLNSDCGIGLRLEGVSVSFGHGSVPDEWFRIPGTGCVFINR